MNQDLWMHIVITAIAVAVILLLLRLNHVTFRRIHERRNALQTRFLERFCGAAILIGGAIVTISLWGGFDHVWKTILGGTAFASAVLIFAAQDVIKDILAGLMISINKPFEIGNRIELEDGTVGIVKDITMRHVVILKLDNTIYSIIPNSKLNAMGLINYSYQSELRSAKFDFYIGYASDVEQAMQVVRRAVEESAYSIPGKKTNEGTDYAPVYFMAYEESSLRLTTTVYYGDTTPSEVLISDINLRVNQALKENGIEIPYAYMNIIERSES